MNHGADQPSSAPGAARRSPQAAPAAPLQLQHAVDQHVDIMTDAGALLFRYVYRPATPDDEAPRPYVHPLYSRAGDMLTNFRPNDHPWHHGLSLTLTDVSGTNFWGGPAYRTADGYQWRGGHGRQVHRAWRTLLPGRLEHDVDWMRDDTVLLRERRVLEAALVADGWMLRWTSEVRNVSGRPLNLENYHSLAGLAGSHYTGLQFRGARDLLDEHGDAAIGVSGDGGLRGENAVHGSSVRWVEWSGQHDGSLRRTRIRFEVTSGPVAWFVRAKSPLVAFAFHRERPQPLAADGILRLDHVLTFAPA